MTNKDDFRSLADYIIKNIAMVGTQDTIEAVAQSLRSTAEEYEKRGWNEAVDACIKTIEDFDKEEEKDAARWCECEEHCTCGDGAYHKEQFEDEIRLLKKG